jgi:hypothetical protein
MDVLSDRPIDPSTWWMLEGGTFCLKHGGWINREMVRGS